MNDYIYLSPVKYLVKLIRSAVLKPSTKSYISKAKKYLYKGEEYIILPTRIEMEIHGGKSREGSSLVILRRSQKDELIDTGLRFNQRSKVDKDGDRYEFNIPENLSTIVFEDESNNTYQIETLDENVEAICEDLVNDGYKIISKFR